MKDFSFSKSRKILFQVYPFYKKKKKHLTETQQKEFEKLLRSLQEALQKKDKKNYSMLAQQLEAKAKRELKKSFFDMSWEIFFALLFALTFALIVRQMWFEFYTIPSGSMRPTVKEQDYMVVSKTTFGINSPGRTSHFYFDPTLVKRGGIVIFTVENMDVSDSNTFYFYIIPGKKQFVKRLIGKPGDTLYFYGGDIYGIDQNGNDLVELRNNQWFDEIEHIPFLRFEGKLGKFSTPSFNRFPSFLLEHMNEPIAQIDFSFSQKGEGTLFPYPTTLVKNPHNIKKFADFAGFKNFAMSKLLLPEELPEQPSEKAPVYLELKHHPDLKSVEIFPNGFLSMHTETSYLPLDQAHLDLLFDHIYTSRFVVKNGKGFRYGTSSFQITPFTPSLPDVPDGTYEFDHGVAYQELFMGVLKKLPKTHPLYLRTPERASLLFNLGFDWDSRTIPSRYAYFKNGDFYLCHFPIFSSHDKELLAFVEKERKKNIPFEDFGPPLKEGKIDRTLIETYGFKVPDHHYFVLGDNHAMSSDSRVFGFVPEENLRGAPSFIFWPIGSRFGIPFQPSYPFFTVANYIVWSLAGILTLSYFYYRRKKLLKPLNF